MKTRNDNARTKQRRATALANFTLRKQHAGESDADYKAYVQRKNNERAVLQGAQA